MPSPTSLTPEEYLTITEDIVRAAKYSSLITLGANGYVHARVMQHFAPEADLTLWFGASPNSRKAEDIRRDNRVTAIFREDSSPAYAVLAGHAEIVTDLDLRRSHWFPEWDAFFPGGPEGDDYALIKMTPTRIELLNFARDVTPVPYGLAHRDLVLTNGVWQVVDGEPVKPAS